MARTKEFDEKEVLNKALHIFWCKGYNGTSMQDLIDGLGISRSSLYDTYGDKYQLYIAALKKYQDEQAGPLINEINSSDSIVETIKSIFKQIIHEAVSDDLKKGCFMVNSTIDLARHDKEIAEMINATDKQMEDAYTRAIKKAQENAEISDHHPARALAKFVMNASKGLRVSARTEGGRKGYEDILQVLLTLLSPASR